MKLCIPIKKKKAKDLVLWLKKACKEADVIEIWFDEIVDLNKLIEPKLKLNSTKPLLYKVSKFNIKKIEYILSKLKKIEYLDCDISVDKNILEKIRAKFPQIKLIISHHDFKKTPTPKELLNLVDEMRSKCADIVKIATKANKMEDSLNMLSLLSQLNKKGQRAICICMGKKGRLTRTTGHLLGNYLMYAPMREAQGTASGQIPIKELKKILKLNN